MQRRRLGVPTPQASSATFRRYRGPPRKRQSIRRGRPCAAGKSISDIKSKVLQRCLLSPCSVAAPRCIGSEPSLALLTGNEVGPNPEEPQLRVDGPPTSESFQ